MRPVTILSQEDTSTPDDTKFQFRSSNYKGHFKPKSLNFINIYIYIYRYVFNLPWNNMD